MRVTITTVVDITETNARRDDPALHKQQQSNYLTLLQTVGLRVQPTPIGCNSFVGDISGYGFGTSIADKQRYWVFEFTYDYVGGLSEEMLMDDFDLVPIVTQLTDTATISNGAFRTKHKTDCNIIFKLSDN
jgi:hypothetical protein|tara:strand:+ start:275 stop:667 length:393 start_codon:yes stop_codon:yes gene_type:complete